MTVGFKRKGNRTCPAITIERGTMDTQSYDEGIVSSEYLG